MVTIDFSLAISIYLIVLISAVLLDWLFNKGEKGKDLFLESRFIWHCCVCTYTYINTKEDTISVCPRCGSYNKK